MLRKAVVEGVPVESACNGSASDLRYRLLMSALTDSGENEAAAAVTDAGDAEVDAPVPACRCARG